MENIKFKVKDSHLTQFSVSKKHPTALDGKTVRVATICVEYEGGSSQVTVYSQETDLELFREFVTHIKYKLRQIVKSCNNEDELTDELVSRCECVGLVYVTDIK